MKTIPTRNINLTLTLGVFAVLLATSPRLHWLLIAFAWAGWGALLAVTVSQWMERRK